MKLREIAGESACLFFVLLFFVFSFGNLSFAEQLERIEYMGNKKSCQAGDKVLTRHEAKGGKSILLRMGHTHFDPLKKLPPQKAGIKQIDACEEGDAGYYIVQFDGPIESASKEALKDRGVEIFDYIPDFGFVTRMNSTKEQAVRALPHVRWLGRYQPSYRISQNAVDMMFAKGKNGAEGETVFLRVTVFPGEDLNRIESEVAALGGVIVDRVTTEWKSTLKLKVLPERIGDLPPIRGIKWIEPVPEWRLFNDVSTDVMCVRTPRDTHGLYGEGQTVGVCDSGLDQGSTNPASLHDDFEDGSGGSRVTQIFDLAGDGANDVNSGHGTHVAGSVLGNGIMSGSSPLSDAFPSTCSAGTAPKANLVFQASQNNSTEEIEGISSDLNTLFSQSDAAGADLHTNSWGINAKGMYTSASEDVDEYICNNPDFLILFSAGNDGKDLDGDGVIDLYSMGAPATAKNCLTVGASEGDRPSGAGCDNNWSQPWPNDYSEDPISSDHVSDDPGGMAAFSSRGPVLDGRYKPDLVAPGTNILSTRSSVATKTGWGEYNSSYMWMGGTSMSTPLSAGAAALMREYFIKQKGFSNPSAALIKAALLNSAEDISPGQYGTGASREIPDQPAPNNVEGWGRLNLVNGVYPVSPFDILYYDEEGSDSLSTGGFREYTVAVSGSGSPLKINLVWTDYPGSPSVQGGLVNDLDLQVTDPSSSIHYCDNASQKSALALIAYDDGKPEFYYNCNKIAVRFTPSAYPANVESTTFLFDNPEDRTTDVDIVVYDDSSDGLPGAQLFKKTLTYLPSGCVTIGITGVVINSGDFYIAVEKNDLNQMLSQDDNDSTGRSYHDIGSGWAVDKGYMAYIEANVRGTDYSTSFDRVNNVLGLTLDNPAAGRYAIKVAGYNVPQGPQPYALVVSGICSKVATGNLQFTASTYSIDENGGAAQISVARTDGSEGPVSVNYATSDDTATGSDYTAASGTLNWADGDTTEKTFAVAITDDTDDETNETVNLTLSSPVSALLGTRNTALLTINDNDEPPSDGGGCFIGTAAFDSCMEAKERGRNNFLNYASQLQATFARSQIPKASK
jgi:subtilisin family serine protease